VSTSRPSVPALVVAVLALVAGGAAFPGIAHAKKRARAKSAKSAESARTKPGAKVGEPSPVVAENKDQVGEDATPGRGKEAGPAPASAAAPAKARVYTFGGLDVTGTLKAPQMLFFRARVQQELDTSTPEKRSFLKELEKTADAKGL
jgi:hypothetical protein